MSRRHHSIASVLAASALAAAALGASAPAPPATSATPKTPAPAAAPKATAPGMAHDHHAMAAKGASDKGKFMTIVGEVMDPACFLEAGAKSIGPGHFQGAVDCVRSGRTLAIYDRAADRIYFIAGELPGKNPNDPVRGYIHQKVDVLGTVYHRSQAWGIVIVRVTPHKAKDGGAPAAAAPAGRSK